MPSPPPTPAPAPATFPPRGWNSWDCFGGSVTETEVLANARFMRDHLLRHGWDTVVVDIQWYEPTPGTGEYHAVSCAVVDPYGRPLPAVGRFPSSADGAGFAPLAAAVHAMGLRLGVHLMRGVPRRSVAADTPVMGTSYTARDIAAPPSERCPWNPDNEGVLADHPGSQAWYDSVLALLAQWGVDLVKVDDVLYPPVRRADITMIHEAIGRCGRDIVLSLSPGRELSLEHADFLRGNAQMWRVSDDLWDDWDAVVEQFQRAARWAPVQDDAGVGDLDMLPLGRLGLRAHVGAPRDCALTLAEQRTIMTLWSVARSPLMMGGHLPESSAETIALLTNDAVLAIGERGSENREIIRDGDLVAWRSTLRPVVGSHGSPTQVRAVFHLGDAPVTRRLHVDDLGLPAATTNLVDLWSGSRIPVTDGWWEAALGAHDAVLVQAD